LSKWRGCTAGAEPDAEHGMAIVTDDSAGGMIDIHDRRPVALTPEAARAWADPSTPLATAREVLAAALPEEAFEWHPVRKEVGNSRYEIPDAIDPV
jgi:putative SOS response-associated peptidase YedK